MVVKGLGLIPAGAGTTGSGRRYPQGVRAHPRRCGDHSPHPNPLLSPSGSSPQVRGPLSQTVKNYVDVRLIPAGAGTTFAGLAGVASIGAHPRRCGDHGFLIPTTPASLGSSPQVRGPLPAYTDAKITNGLIPAGAGTTCLTGSLARCKRAHPRRCGDHSFLLFFVLVD